MDFRTFAIALFSFAYSGFSFGGSLVLNGGGSYTGGTGVIQTGTSPGSGTSTITVGGGTLTLGGGTLTLGGSNSVTGIITPPKSFAYVLQPDALAKKSADAVKKIAASKRDWVIIDPSFNAKSDFTPADIIAIRQGQPGRKVLAYLSIGEAESYRPYWNAAWTKKGKLTASAPSFLVKESPQWKGNYVVKYWQPGWQNIILPMVDKLMGRGFDGIYLDIVDGFESFEFDGKNWIDDRVNPETAQTYRRDMVDLVKKIAIRARAGKSDALIIPQNGVQLLEHADFLSTISAVGIEDLFTNGNTLQPLEFTNYILDFATLALAASKPVLLIEYPTKTDRLNLVQQAARQVGLIWLTTDRALKTLGKSGN